MSMNKIKITTIRSKEECKRLKCSPFGFIEEEFDSNSKDPTFDEIIDNAQKSIDEAFKDYYKGKNIPHPPEQFGIDPQLDDLLNIVLGGQELVRTYEECQAHNNTELNFKLFCSALRYGYLCGREELKEYVTNKPAGRNYAIPLDDQEHWGKVFNDYYNKRIEKGLSIKSAMNYANNEIISDWENFYKKNPLPIPSNKTFKNNWQKQQDSKKNT